MLVVTIDTVSTESKYAEWSIHGPKIEEKTVERGTSYILLSTKC
jgi:hypothetical protein